jgi:hypothetical protein
MATCDANEGKHRCDRAVESADLVAVKEEGFRCRSRYDKPGLVPSEHAKGDAIDIGTPDQAAGLEA